jgi:hypothetical protein
MIRYVLLRPLRPELDDQDQVQIIVTRALNFVTNLLTSTNDHMIRPIVYDQGRLGLYVCLFVCLFEEMAWYEATIQRVPR